MIARGLGLPITLSVVAIEVGRRAGVPIVGIGLPIHFMVREASREVYGDPFGDGAMYDRSGAPRLDRPRLARPRHLAGWREHRPRPR